MKQIKWEDSKFTELIRLSKENKQWIKENKGKKSSAGFLDYLINQAKEYANTNTNFGRGERLAQPLPRYD